MLDKFKMNGKYLRNKKTIFIVKTTDQFFLQTNSNIG